MLNRDIKRRPRWAVYNTVALPCTMPLVYILMKAYIFTQAS